MCVQLEAFAAADPEHPGTCCWNMIVSAIRGHAPGQPAEIAAELNDWADLLEGLADLTTPGAD